MKNIDSQSGERADTVGTTVYPSGQTVTGPIRIFEPNSSGLSGSLARDGNVTDKRFSVHYSDDIQELAKLHDKNGRPISVFPTSIFKGISLKNNHSLMALELAKNVSIAREELGQAIGEKSAVCFHGNHTKTSEILSASVVLPEELAEYSRGKTVIALSPNISVKNKFIGLENAGIKPSPFIGLTSGPTHIVNGY